MNQENRTSNRQPDGYAYRYPDGIRFGTSGRTVNGCEPTETIPFYYGTAPTDMQAERLAEMEKALHDLRELAIKTRAARTKWLESHGVPISQEFAEFADVMGELVNRAEQLLTPPAKETK